MSCKKTKMFKGKKVLNYSLNLVFFLMVDQHFTSTKAKGLFAIFQHLFLHHLVLPQPSPHPFLCELGES